MFPLASNLVSRQFQALLISKNLRSQLDGDGQAALQVVLEPLSLFHDIDGFPLLFTFNTEVIMDIFRFKIDSVLR